MFRIAFFYRSHDEKVLYIQEAVVVVTGEMVPSVLATGAAVIVRNANALPRDLNYRELC
jgi:hypothetical protein